MKKKIFSNQKSERGQAFLELAVSVLFLLILLSAMIDLGWAFYTMIAMRDAAQEGASYGSLCQLNSSIQSRLKSSASSPLNINDISTIDVKYYDDDNNEVTEANADYGNTVKVTLTVNHQIVTPFIGMFIGNNWNYPLTVTVSDSLLRVKKSGC